MSVSGRVYYPNCRVLLTVMFDGFGDTDDDSQEFVIPIIPRRATVHRNKYSQADSYEITFDAGDLPIDPDLVRAGSAEVFLFGTKSLGDAEVVLSRQHPTTDAPGFEPTAIEGIGLDLGLLSEVERWTNGNKPVIAGLFDEDGLELGTDGRWVTIQGQDYTAYLAGRQWPPKNVKNGTGTPQRIPVGRRLDDTMRSILKEADPREKLQLVLRGVRAEELPIVGKNEVAGHSRGIPVQQDTSYWDVLYDLAIRHGFICYVDGLDVVLAKPRNLEVGDEQRVRVLAWGKDIERMSLRRHLGKEVVPTVIVQGYDPKTRKPISVEYPKGTRHFDAHEAKKEPREAKKRTTFLEKIKKSTPPAHSSKGKRSTTVHKKDEYTFYPAYGISDRATLQRMAETLFHLRGRAERRVVLTTRDLTDLRESNLLDLAAGDAVSLTFSDFDVDLISGDAPEDAKIGHLLSKGYGEVMAKTVAKHYSKLEALRRPLRVREVSYDWDVDSGISIEMELVDFVVIDDARTDADVEAQAGADRGAIGDAGHRAELRERRLTRSDGSRVGLGANAREERMLVTPRRTP